MERTTLSAVGALLGELGIRWVLIGALAANRYRTSPRLTEVVDLLLQNAGPGLEVLESAARVAGWRVQRASPEGELLRLRHPELGIADLMIAGTSYQQEAIQRAREEPIGAGETARVLTPEDVIVHKLIAGRSQDLAHIEAILQAKVPARRGLHRTLGSLLGADGAVEGTALKLASGDLRGRKPRRAGAGRRRAAAAARLGPPS